jgi:hypothetical protein
MTLNDGLGPGAAIRGAPIWETKPDQRRSTPKPATMAGATVKTGVDRNNLDEDSGWPRNFLQLLATDAHDLDAERASVAYYRSDNA